MRLTDIETVRKIVQADENFAENEFDDEVVLSLFDRSQLQHANITENSESVKIIRVNAPQADSSNPLVLNDQDFADLDAEKIVPDSVVVADSLVLTTVYVENDDYIVDYDTGRVARSSTGTTIPNGGQVYVWYLPFVVLTSGDDYNIHYSSGEVNRRAGSTIPDGARVYVDYRHKDTTPSDTLLEELIEEMEAYIEPRLTGESMESDNKELKAAATNFVVYSYCMAAALKELQVAGKDKSDNIARRWTELGEKYLALSRQLFSKYLTVNTKALGGLIENRFVKNRSRTIHSPTVSLRQRRF